MSNEIHTPSSLGMLERQVIGAEELFLREHTRLKVLMTRGATSTVVMEAPGFATREDVAAYADRVFSGSEYKVTEQPIGGAYRVLMPVYDFKRAIDVLAKPVGYRALPDRTAAERGMLEDEYRMMMGLEARPKQREMEAMVQDLGLKKALAEFSQDYRLMFSGNLKDGVYVLPIHEPSSSIVRGVETLIAGGTLSPHDAILTGKGEDRQLHITPASLRLVEEALFRGINGKVASVPAVISVESQHVRDRYFAAQRLDTVRHVLVKAQLARMDDSLRADVRAMLNGKEVETLLGKNTAGKNDRLGLEVLARAVEAVAMKRDDPQEARYDVKALRHAIGQGRLVLAEPAFWRSHENSQLASQHNAIRIEHDEALRDLDALLASQPVSQKGLALLIEQPRFASAIRDTGHFLTIVQDAKTKGYDNGADQYQQAFHLTRAALEPRSSVARAASYHIRADIGKVGTGEMIGRNLFMGVRPIISSVDLAFKKPVLFGGAVLGLATYSAAVPEKYRIATLISSFMEHLMQSIGIQHSHDSKAIAHMKRLEKKAIAEGGGSHFRQGMRLGVFSTVGTAIVAFIGFNIIEDIIVHLPLAVGGAAAGTVAGTTGRKVLTPVLNDIGDIAGRFSPEPVRQSFRADKALFKQANASTWLGRMGASVRQFGRDLDEFGVVASGHHVIDSTQRNVASLFNHVMGNAPEKASAAR